MPLQQLLREWRQDFQTLYCFQSYRETEKHSGKRFVKGVLPFSNELRHKQYHIFIMLFDHNQSGTDCGLYFGNDIFPLNKGINRRCVFRQYLP